MTKDRRKGSVLHLHSGPRSVGCLSQSTGKGGQTCISPGMGEIVWIVLFVMVFVSCSALLDLSGVHWVNATWMGSTTIPCTYTLSEGFTLQTLSWSIERDYSISTIFRRDDSGDHILLSRFRGRVSIPKHSPGNASLLIENLEIPDSGHYTCQVIWRSENKSLITKEVTTTVKVVKVPATKPIVRAGEPGLSVPAGSSASLTCEASGSPPLRYRWFRGTPGTAPRLLRSESELAWGSLRPSDAGTYFCEAEGRVGAAQRSDAVELVVTGAAPAVPTPVPYALSAALGAAALGAILAARLRRRRSEPLYEVAFRSSADVTGLGTDEEAPVKCLHKETNVKSETSNDTFTMKDSSHGSISVGKKHEYENLMSAMELEYEMEKPE
ncbi:V-set and immunoglobulin domain-containing protein 4 isoform X2 [Cuculus canorus]|uniref:V-set and immunoglobulin domain-containing protein 4 isoform X2 n=1 Tax=Cuculus canorus TaxID=55661 RepID=UPI0023AA766D|nr:V-set and immunoglobulin domain-containing protein 4 isoform X2 [Cuculus canorus]